MCGFFGRGGWLAMIGGRGPDSDAPRPPAVGDAQACDDDDTPDDDGSFDDCD